MKSDIGLVAAEFRTRPWEMGSGYVVDFEKACEYGVEKELFIDSKNNYIHAIRPSLLPEFKSVGETRALISIITDLTFYQHQVEKVVYKYTTFRNLIRDSCGRSEIEYFRENSYGYSIQRIDYISDCFGQIGVIDPNIVPLGLGLFHCRGVIGRKNGDVLCNYFHIKEKIDDYKSFQLQPLCDFLRSWMEDNGLKGETVYIVTERNFPNNSDHFVVAKELTATGVPVNVVFVDQLFRCGSYLYCQGMENKVRAVWRYGRFPKKELLVKGWKDLYEVYENGELTMLNQPGCYVLENKMWYFLLFVPGFLDLLVGGAEKYGKLINFLPNGWILKVDKENKVVEYLSGVSKKGELRWDTYCLSLLPRSFVLKLADTSGGKGVRIIYNESNRKGQIYFWKYVDYFRETQYFILSEFIKPQKREVVDPNDSGYKRVGFITKDHLYYCVYPDCKCRVIGFSAFARMDNYKVHGSLDTLSIIQYYK